MSQEPENISPLAEGINKYLGRLDKDVETLKAKLADQEREAESRGLAEPGRVEEMEPVRIEGDVPLTSQTWVFRSYVSVSLTPEARDALKAYAVEQSVTLSEAVHKLTETRVGRVVVAMSAKSRREDIMRVDALAQAREAAKLSGGVLLDEDPVIAEVGVVSINGEDVDLASYGLVSLNYRMVKLPISEVK